MFSVREDLNFDEFMAYLAERGRTRKATTGVVIDLPLQTRAAVVRSARFAIMAARRKRGPRRGWHKVS